jgi:hypothetical protein
MKEVSREQIIEASDAYQEAATENYVAFEKEQRKLAYPSYDQAVAKLGFEPPLADHVTLSGPDLLNNQAALRQLGGLRVVAGVKTRKGAAYLPGVVLPDRAQTVRVGLLKSVHDVRGTTGADSTRLFNDMQQLLLAKIAAEHQPDTGKHGKTGGINGAEIGHAVVTAAITRPVDIHKVVHKLVSDDKPRQERKPSTLSASLAATGATDVQLRNGVRKNEEDALSLNQLAGLVIVKGNQVPWPLDLEIFDVSAGFTHAALQTQTERPKPNLSDNFKSLQAEV